MQSTREITSHSHGSSNTAQATEYINGCTCRCSGHLVQSPKMGDAELDKSINLTTAVGGDVIKTGSIVTSKTQSSEGSEETSASKAGEKRRKRDKVGAVIRKIMPGAGVIAGLAIIGERIWEIVEAAS